MQDFADGGEEEDKRKHCEQKRGAAQNRSVECRGAVVSGGLLEHRRRIVQGWTVVIAGVVPVRAGLKETASRKRLVRLVGMECTVKQAHVAMFFRSWSQLFF